ncbi:MAG: sulfatase-like hydrolase/transferase [Verrucomicrobia bacterium]|nr:sulfatase-like hydrolase/transferase [Verrucomicrobiota bacterium]
MFAAALMDCFTQMPCLNGSMHSRKMNIVFLMTDQQRNDHVGWSERARIATPHMDRIAEGCAFQRCLTANPLCMPARCALLTGRYTRQIHALQMSGDLNRDIPTYAQALQKAGYTTHAIGKLHFTQTWRWGRGRGRGLNLHGMNEALKQYGFDHLWEACGKQLALSNFCDYGAQLAALGLLDTFREHVASRGPNTVSAADARFTGEPWPFAEELYPDIVIGDKIVDAIRQAPAGPDAKPFFYPGQFSVTSSSL